MPAAIVTGSVGMQPTYGIRDPIDAGFIVPNWPVRSFGKAGKKCAHDVFRLDGFFRIRALTVPCIFPISGPLALDKFEC